MLVQQIKGAMQEQEVGSELSEYFFQSKTSNG